MSASDFIAFFGVATGRLRAAGFTGIISIVETVGTFEANPSLCGCVDSVVHANIHPFFDPNTIPGGAGATVLSQRAILQNLCGKTVVISETGWPSLGGANASPSDQAVAIGSIKTAVGYDQVTWFSYTDDPWKSGPAVEGHFGTFRITVSTDF
jgi:exo-beta-1,3-glucanase (GH17 family)